MLLNVAGYEFYADVIERSKSISKYTDHELEKIRIKATIDGKEINERVTNYINSNAKEITSKEGSITKKWKLTNKSYSYIDDMESVNYSWELEEIEEPKLDKLVLDGLELTPNQYEEKFDFNNKFWAKARVLLSDIEFGKIKELMEKESITVIRQGINEKPRQMGLSLRGWSKDEKGVKCQFSLHDHSNEKLEFTIVGPLWGLANLAIKQKQIIDHLSNLLIQKGILKKEEYDNIIAGVPDKKLDIKIELYRLKNLDDWKF